MVVVLPTPVGPTRAATRVLPGSSWMGEATGMKSAMTRRMKSRAFSESTASSPPWSRRARWVYSQSRRAIMGSTSLATRSP